MGYCNFYGKIVPGDKASCIGGGGDWIDTEPTPSYGPGQGKQRSFREEGLGYDDTDFEGVPLSTDFAGRNQYELERLKQQQLSNLKPKKNWSAVNNPPGMRAEDIPGMGDTTRQPAPAPKGIFALGWNSDKGVADNIRGIAKDLYYPQSRVTPEREALSKITAPFGAGLVEDKGTTNPELQRFIDKPFLTTAEYVAANKLLQWASPAVKNTLGKLFFKKHTGKTWKPLVKNPQTGKFEKGGGTFVEGGAPTYTPKWGTIGGTTLVSGAVAENYDEMPDGFKQAVDTTKDYMSKGVDATVQG